MDGAEHYREAERLAGMCVDSAGNPPPQPAPELAAYLDLAQVHATLALAAAQGKPEPGACPIRGPRDSYAIQVVGEFHLYENSGLCMFSDGHTGDCQNSNGDRWNTSIPRTPEIEFVGEEGSPF